MILFLPKQTLRQGLGCRSVTWEVRKKERERKVHKVVLMIRLLLRKTRLIPTGEALGTEVGS